MKTNKMLSLNHQGFLFYAVSLLICKTCVSELLPTPAPLSLYSTGESVPTPEYIDIIVRRLGDNLTLVCELKKGSPKVFVWNYMAGNGVGVSSEMPVTYPQDPKEPIGPKMKSTLTFSNLSLSNSGHYICTAPPYSQSKFLLVQPPSEKACALGAFVCDKRCVLAPYVCDGRRDCSLGEDEAASLCTDNPCTRPGQERVNCSGRCVPPEQCCARGSCPITDDTDLEHAHYIEDRHSTDDYGFIQSTIYTVTACALIFMIAVVLLVSAICKMHMKRTALRSYAHHYDVRYAQAYRFPPCYESREDARQMSPTHASNIQTPNAPPENADDGEDTAGGLARLAALFTARYRQVPTQSEVEMTNVRTSSSNSTPTRNRTLHNYRSPTYCDLNSTDFYFNTENCGPELNYMATPLEFFRRRTLRSNSVEAPQRPLTLQLGRFQLSIPRFGRRNSTERRPDTPNVAEINIEDVDFVRLNSNDTYTLNGRTIRLLGGNFENYPILNDANRPPPYTDALRYKLYGPPPEYLSRDCLNERANTNIDEEAANNVEMPPCYDDLSTNNGNLAVNDEDVGADTARALSVENVNNNVETIAVTTNAIRNLTANLINSDSQNNETISAVIDKLPAIDSDVNANDTSSDNANDNDNGNSVVVT